MNILVTGGFGNIGTMLLDVLLSRGHNVTVFDLKTPANEEASKPYLEKVHTIWGDITDKKALKPAIRNKDSVIHLAGIIPPVTELNPDLAYQVNVEGTRNVLKAIQDEEGDPVMIFTSSFAVYGHCIDTPPPRTVDCPRNATDHYSQHKIACEDMVKAQSKPWAILRLGGSFDTRNRHTDKKTIRMMLDVRADNRFEFVHPADVALAIANAAERPEAWNKIHLIGGGKSCQINQYELINVLIGAAGLHIKQSAFGDNLFYSDWMDTSESQKTLEFQQHTFDDLRQELADQLKYIAPFIRPFAPLLSWAFVKWARSGKI